MNPLFFAQMYVAQNKKIIFLSFHFSISFRTHLRSYVWLWKQFASWKVPNQSVNQILQDPAKWSKTTGVHHRNCWVTWSSWTVWRRMIRITSAQLSWKSLEQSKKFIDYTRFVLLYLVSHSLFSKFFSKRSILNTLDSR